METGYSKNKLNVNAETRINFGTTFIEGMFIEVKVLYPSSTVRSGLFNSRASRTVDGKVFASRFWDRMIKFSEKIE